ncbi:hypothetical protein NDI85_20060 [Halomicroarcula sp. S1AR25-4]|uniref:hypothetical protein n=1 Tax=Haloarcula sp. S1AR25-4 TaxID=2950538 RepID=UPI002874907E|nr:hypothetical protein [Halomicroarcula sp. S1AR25-4]MDS0280084.1 hypothetical protein [Halomicroarcula sp. S1AR25-4]
MSILDMVLLGIVGLIVLVSFKNPGGLLLASLIAALIISVRLVAPWVGDYYKQAHSGKVGRMKAQQARQSDEEGGR